jgi:hypothetical protein
MTIILAFSLSPISVDSRTGVSQIILLLSQICNKVLAPRTASPSLSTGETGASITVTPDETTKYYVAGTKDGCEGNAEFTVEVALSIEENESVDANVYPNPTQGELRIECDAMKELTVVMPNGQVVEKINVNDDRCSLDMSEYNSGVYYIKITTKDNNVRIYKSVKM